MSCSSVTSCPWQAALQGGTGPASLLSSPCLKMRRFTPMVTTVTACRLSDWQTQTQLQNSSCFPRVSWAQVKLVSSTSAHLDRSWCCGKRDFQCFHVCCSCLCWCRLQSAGVMNYGKSRNDLSCSFTHSSVVNLWFFSWLCESLLFPSTRTHRSCVNVQLNVLLHLSRLCVDAAWLSVFPHQRRNWVFLCFRVVFGAFYGSFCVSAVLLCLCGTFTSHFKYLFCVCV